MITLKTCHRCRYFQGISYVHPDSHTCKKKGVPAGWYVDCGTYCNDSYVKIVDAADVDGLPNLSYQVLKRFLRLNANHQVLCRQTELKKSEKPGEWEETNIKQLTLF